MRADWRQDRSDQGRGAAPRRLVVRVSATRMVGRVEDLSNLWNRLLDRYSNPLLQCHVSHPAAVAPTSEGDVGDTILDVKKQHGSAVCRHARINSAVYSINIMVGTKIPSCQSEAPIQNGTISGLRSFVFSSFAVLMNVSGGYRVAGSRSTARSEYEWRTSGKP